jgi:hypothetical protein
MQVCYALQLPQLIFHLRREEVQKFISLIEAVFYVKCMEDVVDILASSLIRRQPHAPTRCMISQHAFDPKHFTPGRGAQDHKGRLNTFFIRMWAFSSMNVHPRSITQIHVVEAREQLRSENALPLAPSTSWDTVMARHPALFTSQIAK